MTLGEMRDMCKALDNAGVDSTSELRVKRRKSEHLVPLGDELWVCMPARSASTPDWDGKDDD